ncbi:MAG: GDP-mannose 4,6-dehydratase [Verrucomicrobiaceae bacterium]|nr:GDP-mannose 4,6-dehydratase [Verrucomicrobiaceae bacterium]
MNRSLIIGCNGQDGRLLQARLAEEGSEVTALGRGDLLLEDSVAVRRLVKQGFQEIYYLAAHHHSSEEIVDSGYLSLYLSSVSVNMNGLMHFLEAILHHSPATRLFYAGSSLVFGAAGQDMQDEQTPFDPRCIYGITKSTGLRLCRYYRDNHGVFAAGGILFNHESSIRSQKFVIPKIIHAALAIASGTQKTLKLGTLSSRVDWGYAADYVRAMIAILRLPAPDDFVIATGVTHSVQDAVEIVFTHLGLDWRKHVEEAPQILVRKRTVLCGNAAKLRRETGWSPTIGFKEMLIHLVETARNA